MFMKIQEYATKLFEVHVNTHIAHLQTDKYSDHMALDDFYKGIVDLRDRFIETYQGKYSVLKNYSSFKIENSLDYLSYLKEFLIDTEETRDMLADGYLQQILDDVIELTSSTIYKIKTLTK